MVEIELFRSYTYVDGYEKGDSRKPESAKMYVNYLKPNNLMLFLRGSGLNLEIKTLKKKKEPKGLQIYMKRFFKKPENYYILEAKDGKHWVIFKKTITSYMKLKRLVGNEVGNYVKPPTTKKARKSILFKLPS